MSENPPQNSARGLVRYDESLDEEIFAFQKKAYPHRREDWIASRWRWMFLDSAARLGVEPMVWLFRNRDGVVGHQAAIPVKLRAGESEHITGWFVETMVLEPVRGKSVGPMVIQKAKEDLPFNLSLGQTEQMRQIQFALGWQQVCPMHTYAFALKPGEVLSAKIGNRLLRAPVAFALGAVQRLRHIRGRRRLDWKPEVRRLDRFDESHDELWRRLESQYSCAVVRDASYLNWKYVEQPGQDFRRLEIRREGKPVAVAVVMVREPRRKYTYRRGYVVDLVAPMDDADVVWATLEAARAELCEMRADLIFMHLISEALAPKVASFGFMRREAKRVLLISPDGVPKDVARDVLDPSAWFATHGDSDIDRPW